MENSKIGKCCVILGQKWQGAEIFLLLDNNRTLQSCRMWIKVLSTDPSAWSDEPDIPGKPLPGSLTLWEELLCVFVGGHFPERSR